MRWRAADDIASAAVSSGSPYDKDAHDARKATRAPSGQWVGYEIHVTEAYDDDAPRLITHVATTTAPVVDAAVLPAVHHVLHVRALLPAVQLLDSGYLDAPQIVAAHDDCAIALRGPTRPDDQ